MYMNMLSCVILSGQQMLISYNDNNNNDDDSNDEHVDNEDEYNSN